MAFTGLKVTDFGKNVQAKTHADNPVKFTRIVLGDGILGNGSMVARKKVISETISIPIQSKRMFENVASLIGLLSNKNLETGFYFREMAPYCLDPETGEEGAFSYDNCREEGEYIGDKNSKPIIHTYLRMRTAFLTLDDISFPEWPNPVYILADEFDPILQKISDFQSHIDDTTVHITPPEKNRWNKATVSGLTTGSAAALEINGTGDLLQDGTVIRFPVHTYTIAGATLNFEGTGAKPILNDRGGVIRRIREGAWITVVYSAAKDAFIVQGDAGGALRYGNAPGQISSFQRMLMGNFNTYLGGGIG